MKLELEKLILGTAHAIRAWASVSGNAVQLATDGLRPSFVAYRLACAMAEMEELLAVHKTLWPQDQEWRERNGELMVGRMYPKAELCRNGAVVAEEERPELALAQSQDIGDLFDFFCQVRNSLLYDSANTDGPDKPQSIRVAIDAAMEAIQVMGGTSRAALEGALAGYISNSFLYSNARLPSGAALGERYWPLFRAVQLLRREKQMNVDEIRDILEQAEIRSEIRDRVSVLIDALRRMLSDFDFDRVRDILASEGHLYPGMGDDGGIVVIPGDSPARCAPIVLAIAKGRDGRSRYGLPNVMREVRAHLIQCFEIAEVVVLLTDRWDPDIMKESEADFSAYASRPSGAKVIIPIVSWKRQLTAYDWP